MVGSVGAQLKGGLSDVWEKGAKELVDRIGKHGPVGAWHTYRNRAYAFSMNEIGKNFNEFNVEQQASLIESWYAGNSYQNHLGENIPGADRSALDSRYSYITQNIRAGAPSNAFVALQPLGQGADAEIKRIQDKLVELGYLEEKRADGYMGRFSRDAVMAFQKRNGLKVDGDIGGSNSETRKKLRLPISQLTPVR